MSLGGYMKFSGGGDGKDGPMKDVTVEKSVEKVQQAKREMFNQIVKLLESAIFGIEV
jgi:hypothetical protein